MNAYMVAVNESGGHDKAHNNRGVKRHERGRTAQDHNSVNKERDRTGYTQSSQDGTEKDYVF